MSLAKGSRPQAGSFPRRDAFPAFFEALEARHRADLSFAEIRRALQALSSLYVERRERMRSGAAFDGRGKRAAFALYYGPLHFLLVREIVRALGPARPTPPRILDLGCGTGTAGAAWALEREPAAEVVGVDLNGWAVTEADHPSARAAGPHRARRRHLRKAPSPPGRRPRCLHRQRAGRRVPGAPPAPAPGRRDRRLGGPDRRTALPEGQPVVAGVGGRRGVGRRA